MRSRLAAAAVVLLSALVLFTASHVRAGQRVPSGDVPVKEAIEKMKKAKAPPAAIALVRFYADVFGGKTVELYQGDFTNAGRTDEALIGEISKTQCGKLNDAQLKAASALATEYGDALPMELRGYVLAQQGKGEQAGPLLMKALEAIQPLDRCNFFHPDDASEWSSRVGAWSACVEKYSPKADKKKLEAIQKKNLQCVLETAGTVG